MGDIKSITSGEFVFQMMLAVGMIAVIIFWLVNILRNSAKKSMFICLAIMGIALAARNFLNIVNLCIFLVIPERGPATFAAAFFQLTVAGGLVYISVNIITSYKSATVWKYAFIMVPFAMAVIIGTVNRVFVHTDIWKSVGVSIYSMIVISYCWVSHALGLLPNNRMLRTIFERSALNMQIINSSGTEFVLSKNAKKPDENTLRKILCGTSTIMTDENTVLVCKKSGRNFIAWEHDISEINAVRHETAKLVKSLVSANKILSEREQKEKKVETKRVAAVISAELENRLRGKLDELSQMSEKIAASDNYTAYLPEIALLLCYIKRSVNFYFISREKDFMECSEYTVFVDELCEIAEYLGTRVMNIDMVAGAMDIRVVILGYEFLYEFLLFAARNGIRHVLIKTMIENGIIYLRMIPSKHISVDEMSPKLLECIQKMHFIVEESYEEDTFMISFHVDREYLRENGYTLERGKKNA